MLYLKESLGDQASLLVRRSGAFGSFLPVIPAPRVAEEMRQNIDKRIREHRQHLAALLTESIDLISAVISGLSRMNARFVWPRESIGGSPFYSPDLLSGQPSRSVKDPAVPLDRVGDPVLARIDQAVPVRFPEFASGSDAEMLQLSVDEVLYLVVRKSLQQFGDTVNAAQRLEDLGKGVASATEVTILISSTTRSQLPVEFTRAAVGSHPVKGKAERIDVYQLLEQEAETQRIRRWNRL